MTFFADMLILVITDMPISIFSYERISYIGLDMSPNADIQISAMSALKMFADSRYSKKSADMPMPI